MTMRGRRREGPKFSERLTIMVSEDLRRALEMKADVEDRSIGEIARKVLIDSLMPRVEEKAG